MHGKSRLPEKAAGFFSPWICRSDARHGRLAEARVSGRYAILAGKG
ncbi:hypothetical protein PAMC26510_05020 [Caballeronia sordidicola]|jgi:hypothetical protein|uniref:Uncharacterized protein n=1 Tax=Caballeronia sordidicola TaxID=196367 RepID=A0A242N1E7_CABSO|nr:hypothetical protein PAMC26577_07690 [Caballeronia sordidicola]OTP79864.1 hypothetical protein PAMC26510_05020 [Caballeronia sordidicola]